jgi:hypothetical protein
VAELLVAISPHYQRVPPLAAVRAAGRSCASLRTGNGTLSLQLDLLPGQPPADVLVGLFADPVPQCGPVAFGGAAGMSSGQLSLTGVPAGCWTAIAVARHRVVGAAGTWFSIGYSTVQVGAEGLFTGQLALRAPAQTDAPIAITLASRQSPFSQRMLAMQRPNLRAVA